MLIEYHIFLWLGLCKNLMKMAEAISYNHSNCHLGFYLNLLVHALHFIHLEPNVAVRVISKNLIYQSAFYFYNYYYLLKKI